MISGAQVRQKGQFWLGKPKQGSWKPFTAVQNFSVQPPGFVWDATIQMAPFLHIRIRDNYTQGVGSVQVSILGFIPLINVNGGFELASGSLHRYLAEAVWLPTALLPSDTLTWSAIDDKTARATLTDGEISVSLDFQFGEKGEIIRALTPHRFREEQGKFIPTPWVCRYGRYTQMNGMQLPTFGEVEWILPDGPMPVGRIELTEFIPACNREISKERYPLLSAEE